MDKIQPYRQPTVTVTGILLGFILSFASTWVSDTHPKSNHREIIVATTLALCITTLLVVLYRILNIHYPRERAEKYYKKTLVLLLIGLSIPFATILIFMIENLLTP